MSNSQSGKIDGFDAKILEIIQKSNKTTSDQIAEQVCLSPAAVQRRIKKMREQNIIEAEIAVVNAKAVDRNVTAIVQVSMEREQLHLLDEFKKIVKNHPAVQQCYYVTGSSDFILVVTARDMEDYEAFTREIFFDNSNVRSFQTSVVMDNVKIGLSVPVIVEGE
ncbi:Lrp/AsnC family transcriptional regulator [Terasakiella sp. A23]|uniref:Lrp/AsnC family transcriptional regulator n=1 Tax=Terasakiella sp. FCG-A23 TaxID=3080561 RepID=UPI002953D038|nr:Lrp/AsnC family transcriptional regulator [Terasakiella sp. A23]MDV7341488.1 Lrp/AsnC family transcriptional regulator [Terasakiella sp. A23]